jgi:hypothetical protein
MPQGFPRIFTLSEANETLERLQPTIAEMRSGREEILELRPDLSDALEDVLSNGFTPDTAELLQAFERVESAVRAIQEDGVLVKDINTGLLDFPSEREGRIVFLCWRYGELGITHWHDVNTGFSGRQPL